jgi:hypothetical protein
MFECRNWKRVHQVAGLMREKIYNRELMLIFVALTVAGCLMTAGAVLALGRLLSDDDGVAIGMPGSGGQPASSAQHRALKVRKKRNLLPWSGSQTQTRSTALVCKET